MSIQLTSASKDFQEFKVRDQPSDHRGEKVMVLSHNFRLVFLLTLGSHVYHVHLSRQAHPHTLTAKYEFHRS